MTFYNRNEMLKIRGVLLGSLLTLMCVIPGCVKQTAPVATVDRSPLIIDDAMANRQWARTTVHFQNGETPATPTGFILEHNPNAPAWTPVLTDFPLFLANVGFMPVGYVFTPPWTRVIYPTGVAEPSYTGIPPQTP
jgi:hypothetical protein